MKTKKDLLFLIISLIAGVGVFGVANAVNPFDISYPISELGNCASQEECKTFCDNADNQIVCMDWAAGKGFVEKKEAEKIREIQELGQIPDSYGPGGCKTPGECDNYCRELEHLDECMDYSVEKGFISVEDAAKIKEKANRKGPGGCSSQGECENYCRNPEHIGECMDFAVEDGKISREDADFITQRAKTYGGPDGKSRGPKGPKIDEDKAKQVLELKGGGPGGCKGMEECSAYCGDVSHAEECTSFAVENGFMPPEEAEKAKKMMTMAGPGGCKGPKECDAFCGKEENRDECFKFAKESGMMPPEEVRLMEKEMEIVKKLEQRGGPGGCKGPEECRSFCQNPENIEMCMNFASDSGMMKKGEAEGKMREMRQLQTQMQIMDQDREKFMRMGPPPGFEGFMKPPEGFKPPEGYRDMKPSEGAEGFIPSQEGTSNFAPPPEGWEPPEGMSFPQGMMPTPELMQQIQQQQMIPPQTPQFYPGNMTPPEGFVPPEGGFTPGEMMQPPAGMMPPSDNMMPPPSMMPEGNFSTPPPSSDSQSAPPPIISPENLPGLILKPFLDIFLVF